MAGLDFDYPSVLTKKEWKKHKGFIAKIAVGKTDVGDALETLETDFNRYQFGAVQPFAGTDPSEYLDYEQGLVDGLKKSLTAFKRTIQATKQVVDDAVDEFEDNKAVPKASVKYAQSVSDALDDLEGDLTTFIDDLGDELRDLYRDKLHKLRAYLAGKGAAADAEKIFKDVIKMIRDVEADPTIDTLSETFKPDGPHRTLTTNSKLWDRLIVSDFPTLARNIYGGTAMTDYCALPMMEAIANETNGDASAIARQAVSQGGAEDRVVKGLMLRYSSSVVKNGELLKYIKAVFKVVNDI